MVEGEILLGEQAAACESQSIAACGFVGWPYPAVPHNSIVSVIHGKD